MNHQNDFADNSNLPGSIPQIGQSNVIPANQSSVNSTNSPLTLDQYLQTGSNTSQPATGNLSDLQSNQSTPKVTDGNTASMTTSAVVNQPSVANIVNQEITKSDDVNKSGATSEFKLPATPTVNQDDVISEIEELQSKVDQSAMPEELRERAGRSIERLRRMAKRGSYTGEFETVEKYIYWITSIPWGKKSKDSLNIENAKRVMDSSHYGMNTVKNLVLDYLAVMQLQLRQGDGEALAASQGVGASADMAVLRGSSANAPVMLFTGLQGVGKTSIAKSIAQALGRKFMRVAVGAVGSVQALRGQSRAFLDAEPGQIVKALVRTGTMNPVILLDEIDKASGNSSLLNDIMAALLEILDPEQNATFQDHYIDFPVDLSNVFFICTSNNLGTLSAALLDRMEVIRFTSYSDEEKTVIAKNYALPKVIKNMGIEGDKILIDEPVWPILVRPVGFDAGLRQLERNIATMVRSAARKIVEGSPTPIHITVDNVREFVLPDQGPLS